MSNGDLLLAVGCAAAGAAWGWAAAGMATRAACTVDGKQRDGPAASYRALAAAALAAVFAACAWRFGASPTLPLELAFLAGAAVLAWCDGRWLLLPSRAIYATLGVVEVFVVVEAWAGGHWGRLVASAGCGLVAFGLLFLLNALNPRWLAFGDVRFGLLMGAALGWVGVSCALAGFVVANLLGVLVGVVGLARGGLRWDTPLPYGLFLAAGSVVALLAR